MDELVDDRDVLLLARAKDLQHEYENLVRSLDAAYDAVRQINAAMVENRSEAKRVFQDRLELLASRPKRQDGGENVYSATGVISCDASLIEEPAVISRDSDGLVRNKPHAVFVTGGSQQRDNVKRYVIALPGKKEKGNKTTTIAVAPASSAAAQKSQNNIGDATATSLIYVAQQKTIGNQQRIGTKGYVGDEHSYAEIDTETGLIDNSVTQDDDDGYSHCATYGDNEGQVDLSIVKSEAEDWDVMHDSNADTESMASSKAPTIASFRTLYPKNFCHQIRPNRRRSKIDQPESEDALMRKRVMTRNRMRRWRAKKRLEQLAGKYQSDHN